MKRVCVFCGSSLGNNQAFIDSAKELGKRIAEAKLELIYGGAKIGLMGIIANEVIKRKGKVIGIIPKFLSKKEIINKNVTKLYQVNSMHQRKKKMYDISDAFIALPGGIGTLEELSEILTWNQLSIKNTPVGILNIDGYYDNLIKQFNVMGKNNFFDMNALKTLIISTSPNDLIKACINQTKS